MRRRAVVPAFVLTLALAHPALAQDSGTRFGLGVGITSSLFSNLDAGFTPTIYLPIEVSDQLLIEPSLGLVRFSESMGNLDSTETFLSIGAGILFVIAGGSEDRIYIGPRVGFLRVSESISGPVVDADDSSTNLQIGGVVGGEHFLRPNFSLGGEAGLNYTSLDDIDGSILSTTAEFRIRWYFP